MFLEKPIIHLQRGYLHEEKRYGQKTVEIMYFWFTFCVSIRIYFYNQCPKGLDSPNHGR